VSEQPSYWLEFLKHPHNQVAVAAMVAGTVLLSFPWGGDAWVLGGLLIGSVEAIGLAIVPSLGSFRASVDRKRRRAEREQRRSSLLAEVGRLGGSSYEAQYEAICERVQSLYRTAADRSTVLSEREVEQLDDLSVDYLRLCLSDAVMSSTGSQDAVRRANAQARELESKLRSSEISVEERSDLERVLAELRSVGERNGRMAARRSTLDAALLSMPVRIEEMYQMVLTSARSTELTQMLEESVSRLRMSERAMRDLDLQPEALEAELNRSGGTVHGVERGASIERAAPIKRAVSQRQK
jgi:hypothetical protein